MRRSLLSVVVISLLIASLTPAASASSNKRRRPSARTVEVDYEGFAIPFVTCIDCPEVSSYSKERYVSVEVLDDVNPRGFVDIVWDPRSDDDPGYFSVCGKTSAPQMIPPGAQLTIFPWAVPATNCPTGFSTSGVVKLTFYSSS